MIEYITPEDVQNLIDSGITTEEYAAYLSKKRGQKVTLVIKPSENEAKEFMQGLEKRGLVSQQLIEAMFKEFDE